MASLNFSCGATCSREVMNAMQGVTTGLIQVLFYAHFTSSNPIPSSDPCHDSVQDLRPAMLDETLKYLSPSKYDGTFGPPSQSFLTAADKEAVCRRLLVNTHPKPFNHPTPSYELPRLGSYHEHKLRELQAYNPQRAREHLDNMHMASHAKYEVARQLRL